MSVVWLTYLLNARVTHGSIPAHARLMTLGTLLMSTTATSAQVRNLLAGSPVDFVTGMVFVSTLAILAGCYATHQHLRAAQRRDDN